ncbi:MAG: esterase-like activity of phytase family protein, partial [Pseudomonadota bacterium]
GPDGCLYVVARRYAVASGFTFRVRRLSGGPAAWRDDLLYVSPPAHLGNAEGLGVWQEAGGDLGVTLITDDGFWPLTSTRLIEMRLPPGEDCALGF